MTDVEIRRWEGERDALLPSFRLAEDSEQELAEYVNLGEVFVAFEGAAIVGHLQLVTLESPERMEIMNMAVAEDRRGMGIGRALVAQALTRARELGARILIVGTGAADTGNLRFYQRQGFRMASIERGRVRPRRRLRGGDRRRRRPPARPRLARPGSLTKGRVHGRVPWVLAAAFTARRTEVGRGGRRRRFARPMLGRARSQPCRSRRRRRSSARSRRGRTPARCRGSACRAASPPAT